MMAEEMIFQIFIGMCATIISSGIVYMIHVNRKMLKRLDTHDRLFFGEEGVDAWKGILSFISTLDEKTDKDHKAITRIVECLQENKLIETSSPLYQAMCDDIKSNL